MDNNLKSEKLEKEISSMSADEKKDLKKNLEKIYLNQNENEEVTLTDWSVVEKPKPEYIEELSLFDKIILFFLSLFGISSPEEYSNNKELKKIKRELRQLKISLYNFSKNTLTEKFAEEFYNLSLKALKIRKILKTLIDNKQYWNENIYKKNVVEILFESLIMSEGKKNDTAEEIIRKTLNFDIKARVFISKINDCFATYYKSIDSELINNINYNYTNFMMIKKLIDYNFVKILKRFDLDFNFEKQPSFNEVPGEAIVIYLREFDEILNNIDIGVNNLSIFDILNNVYSNYVKENEIKDEEYNDKDIIENYMKLLEIIKEWQVNKYLPNLIKVIRNKPYYETLNKVDKADLFSEYTQAMERRVKEKYKRELKNYKISKANEKIKNYFTEMKVTGIYNEAVSRNLEEVGLVSFPYAYQLSLIYTIIKEYYYEHLNEALSELVVSGNFVEKSMEDKAADTRYTLKKFVEDLERFVVDLSVDGEIYKKINSYISMTKDKITSEQKKVIERNIITLNNKAKEFCTGFTVIYSNINDILSKINIDIRDNSTKYIKNIKHIGGLKNHKIVNSLAKCAKLFNDLNEAWELLMDIADI